MRESTIDFDPAFKALTGHTPFPWQRRLFKLLSSGELPPAVDVPTGLGKTAVMAIWLLARANGASLPRRLAYVVDRRAVVDQATDVAERLRGELERPDLESVRSALRLAGRRLPISTLRGQHVDNREWLEDPAGPAIIVGTVDMIGSRLLFEGYGVSRGMRPFQAGLLGCDTLVLLDEAHLARPFERLLKAIEAGRRPSAGEHDDSADGRFTGSSATASIPRDRCRCASASRGGFTGSSVTATVPPPFRVLPLSATLGSTSERVVPFTVGEDDRVHETVRRRLDAPKTLTVENLAAGASIEDALAERAWDLACRMTEAAGQPIRMLIYCDRRTVAEKVAEDLRRRKRAAASESVVILFVGGRRVRERQLAAEELRTHGLLAGSDARPDAPVFLVATSAGEVGVDLDADHMVCDLVAWERMVQRLGRVNRLGSRAARVLAIDQGPPEKKVAGDEGVARHSAVRTLLAELPRMEGGHQAGPAALVDLAARHGRTITQASTPMPLHPALTRPLVDAWSMTSLVEHTGRPEVDPWLRGWQTDEPRTTVVWRRYLPVCFDGGRVDALKSQEVEAFFDEASVHVSERLETETWRVVDWLRKRTRKLAKPLERAASGPIDMESDGPDAEDRTGAAEAGLVAPLRQDAPVAFLFDKGGKPNGDPLSLQDAAGNLKPKDMTSRIVGRLLVVDARVCGLCDGLLNADAGKPVSTIEENWGHPERWDEVAGRAAEVADLPAVRVRLLSEEDRERRLAGADGTHDDAARSAEPWRELWAAGYRVSETDRPVTWLIVEQRRGRTSGEDGKAIARTSQSLVAHQARAAEEASRIADALGLDEEDRMMLEAAARIHDEGKRASRWQRAFNAPRDGGPYAKTPGPFNRHVLNGYRHEFQSMLDVQKNGLDGLDRSDPRFDLALHLIAAHHGRARPAIGIDGCEGLPPSAAAARAYEVGRRFARLQRRWGPWGLAWWEALLRAADQRASRALDESARAKSNTPVANTPSEFRPSLFSISTGAPE